MTLNYLGDREGEDWTGDLASLRKLGDDEVTFTFDRSRPKTDNVGREWALNVSEVEREGLDTLVVQANCVGVFMAKCEELVWPKFFLDISSDLLSI